MWPFRPDTLTQVLTAEEIRDLLRLGADVGSALTVVERVGEQEYVSIVRDTGDSEDPFCDTFRHGQVGGKPAFEGADEACDRCEQRFARRILDPSGTAPLPSSENGVGRLRCHMGLTDCIVPIQVGGRTVAALIGGRRVGSEDDRQRIRKATGKLGKLTKAELESSASNDRTVIRPAAESARERLIQEIPRIPRVSESFEEGMVALGRILSRIATGQHEATRWARDEALVESVHQTPGGTPDSAAALQRATEGVLRSLREALAVEFLAFFAILPGRAAKGGLSPSLVAESGLDCNTARRLLELDWDRLPPESPEPQGDLHRALASAAALMNALNATADAPRGLKDRITKSFLLVPVSCGQGRRAALAFGPPRSEVTPRDGDHGLLLRLARTLARWYYGLGMEVEREILHRQLEKEADSRRRVEEARRSAELKIKEAEAARKEESRRRGFTHFDFRKLVAHCLEKVTPVATSGEIELDSRALSDRLMFDGDRNRLQGVVEQILLRCIARTEAAAEGKKAAPVRVFIKKGRDSFVFGAEAIGRHFSAEERRRVFSRDKPPTRGSPTPRKKEEAVPTPAPSEAGPEEGDKAAIEAQKHTPEGSADRGSGETPAPVELPETVGEILAVVRRHRGRFRIESERLHRFEGDSRRWMGRTAFLLELPLSIGKKVDGRGGPGRKREAGEPEEAPPVVDTKSQPGSSADAGAEA